MPQKIPKFNYDEISDSLIVSRKQPGEKCHGGVELGNLIIDFTSKGKIINVEIQNISKFLQTININPEILTNLDDVDLVVQREKGAAAIFILLQGPELKQTVSLGRIPYVKKLSPSV